MTDTPNEDRQPIGPGTENPFSKPVPASQVAEVVTAATAMIAKEGGRADAAEKQVADLLGDEAENLAAHKAVLGFMSACQTDRPDGTTWEQHFKDCAVGDPPAKADKAAE